MTVKALAEKYGFEPASIPYPEREIHGCYIGDLLSWVMGRAEADNIWITIMTNVNVTAVGSLTDVSAVIIAEGAKPDASLVEIAQEKGVNILMSDLTAFELAVKISNDI